jgi:hypothetical protein
VPYIERWHAFRYPTFVVKKKVPFALWLIWSLKELQFLPDLLDYVSSGFRSLSVTVLDDDSVKSYNATGL